MRATLQSLTGAVLVATTLGFAPTGAADGGCGPFDAARESPGGSVAPAEPTGQALLALPKGPDGSIRTDFVLAAGAQVAESFFSPVLCATVVRVVGPVGAAPTALVTRIPQGAIVVPHSAYRPAASAPRDAAGPDPYRVHQYALERMEVQAARSVTDGAGVRVALLDAAPDATHRDLAAVQVLPLAGGPAPSPTTHGTLLAGLIAAEEGNDFGIAGVAPGAELLAIPVCAAPDGSGPGACRLYDLLRGIDRAWEAGAQILNLSLVGPPNPLLERSVSRAERIGLLVVAAAGNDGSRAPRYPAAYPAVIGVGAIDRDGAPLPNGNRSPAVEVLAPGVEIVSTAPGDAFAFADGTSLAAAHVSGALALGIAAGGDADAARAALFRASQDGQRPPVAGAARLPPICAVLARLGRACPAP